jgi:hypothetical protein
VGKIRVTWLHQNLGKSGSEGLVFRDKRYAGSCKKRGISIIYIELA